MDVTGGGESRFRPGRGLTWPSSNLRGRGKRVFTTGGDIAKIVVVLLTLRIPVIDLRPFCYEDYPQGFRLPVTWSENEDFVRYFGPVTKRLGGPVDPWTSERAFCRYDRALRFPPSYPALIARDVSGLVFFGLKRRLYPATTRNDLFHADVQIAGRSGRFSFNRKTRLRSYSPTQFDLVATVSAVLSMPTTVRSAGGAISAQPAGRLGPPIARAFDAATTVGGRSGRVVSGALAIAMEVDERDEVLAAWGGVWDVGEGLRLAARTVVFEGRAINVFVVERSSRVDRHRVRALRIHVLRLHAEREYLRSVARLLATEGFLERCEHTQTERIQHALNQCLAMLTRAGSYGFSTPEITTAFLADRTLAGADLEVLIERVSAFRPVIARRLQKLGELDEAAEAWWRRFLEQNPKEKNFIYVREAHMSQYDQRGSQIGAAGDHASASNFAFGGQLNLGTMSSADAESLRSALRTLRKHLADQLLRDSVIEVDSQEISPMEIGNAIGALSEAEQAIEIKDEQRAENALRRSGRWLASFAQGVGVELAAAVIRASLHLP